ncbi:MAG: thiolase family protein [Tissierellia bacterium]|nr:thiolase family protein [Tissierellia bacterium]
MKLNDVVIVSTARTAIGDFCGSLKNFGGVDLANIVVNGALQKAGIDPADVEEVAYGCIYKNGQHGNPARQVQVKTGIPTTGWAYTIDQQCASGMKAFELVTQSLALGKASIGIAVGSESMTNAPYLLLNARMGYRMGPGSIEDSMLYDGLVCDLSGYHMGVTAENLAKEYSITREEQDELSVLSHKRAIEAINKGVFKEDIIPVEIKSKKGSIFFDTDEHPRANTSMETLSKMKPAFLKDGTVTAGNASGVNDAACALILTTAQKADELGLKPLARVVSTANFGVEPKIMGIGPAYAVPKAIKLAGLTADAIDYYEINEAFAAQFIAVNRVLKLSMDKVNANGSGISLGHPVGCTGARIIQATITELKRRNQQYGVAALCVGGGPAMSVVVENII